MQSWVRSFLPLSACALGIGCASSRVRLEDAEARALFSTQTQGAQRVSRMNRSAAVIEGDGKCFVLERNSGRVVGTGSEGNCHILEPAAVVEDADGFRILGLSKSWDDKRDDKLLDVGGQSGVAYVFSGRSDSSKDAAVRARLTAFDADGHRRWELPFLPFDLDSAPRSASLLSLHDAVLVSVDGRLARVDQKQGSLDWHKKLGSKAAGRFVDGGSAGALLLSDDRIALVEHGGIAWERVPRAGAKIEGAAVVAGRWLIDTRNADERTIHCYAPNGELEWSVIRADPEPRVAGTAVVDETLLFVAGERLVSIDVRKGSAVAIDRVDSKLFQRISSHAKNIVLTGADRVEARSAADARVVFSIPREENWGPIMPSSSRMATARLGSSSFVLIRLEDGTLTEVPGDDVPSGCTAEVAIDDAATWAVEVFVGSCAESGTVRGTTLEKSR